MNAYEIRHQCLEMAERQLHNQQQKFTTEELFTHAGKLYDFVQHGNTNTTKPKAWINPEDFIENLSIEHPVNGKIPFKLYDYQKVLIGYIGRNRHILINTARQMGITSSIAAYLLWYAYKHDNKHILIASDTFNTCKGIKAVIDHFMSQSKIHFNTFKHTKMEMEFENGSTILFGTVKDIPNKRRDIIWIDNAAYISPIKTSGIGLNNTNRVILTSTPYKKNGLFYDLWCDDSDNPWLKYSLKWDQHPDRDDDWVNELRKRLGVDSFVNQYENKFIE